MSKTKESTKIDRRSFVLYIIAVSGISFIGGSLFYSKKIEEALKNWPDVFEEQTLADFFSEIQESTEIIGQKYIMNHSEISKSELMHELKNRLKFQEMNQKRLFSLAERIKHEITNDFKNSQFVVIDNWILTRTEAQLCALLYL